VQAIPDWPEIWHGNGYFSRWLLLSLTPGDAAQPFRETSLMTQKTRLMPMTRYCVASMAAVCLMIHASNAPAADVEVDSTRPRRAERLIFNEETGEWEATSRAVPGTAGGDLDIARQYIAEHRFKRAEDLLDDWIDEYGPEADRYPEALYFKGTALLERGRYRDAQDTYSSLLNDFPGSEYAEAALGGLFRVAEQYLAGERRRIWGGLLRLKDYDEGLSIMDDLIVNYSDTPYAELAQMAKADYYFARGEFELAESEYTRFAQEYPRSRWHKLALLRSAHAALGRFPGIEFDDSPLIEAKERFLQLREAYPAESQQQKTDVILDQIAAKRADKTLSIAKFYQKTEKYQAARYYYREIVERWPDTVAAVEAQGRLNTLTTEVDDDTNEEDSGS
jgi:outer membrane assembly lipoprotein YfiO